MKTLSLSEAEAQGFTVIRSGLDRYLPVALPREVALQDRFQQLTAEQFDPRFEASAVTTGDRTEGYFTQTVQDWNGAVGLPGTTYIVRAHYSENDGVQDWQAFGAVKIS